MSETLDVTGDGREAAVARAAEALRAGELVVVPTDTVYGVAADAFNLDGTARIFRAKSRSRGVPLPVLVRSPKQLAGLTTRVPEEADRLAAAYWPGALTIVLPAEPNLRWDVGRGEGAVAVRMPLDDVALEVIRAVGPLALTGAQRAGGPGPTTVEQAHEQLGDAVALYLDDGPRTAAVSTIVDLTRRQPAILRDGPLPAEEVLAVARGELDPFEATGLAAADEQESETAPGEGDGSAAQG